MALKDGLVKLKAFAAAPWFPVLVGLLSGANLFLLVMSAPLVILYCSAVLANPKRGWLYTAIANAVGTVLGCLILIILMEERGMDFIKESFPATWIHKWWSWTEGMMQSYGSFAAVPVSAMPIILHPLIFFAKLSKMSDFTILLAILVGRIIKYSTLSLKVTSKHELIQEMKFGLQQPQERRHFHLSTARGRDFLLQSLDVSSGKAVLSRNMPGFPFPYKGFRLVQVESSESLQSTDPLHQLRSMKNFPAEVAFQGFGGNLQLMEEPRERSATAYTSHQRSYH
eukprot:Skav228370  [mRNA]  locus=scaffold1981:230342:241021:+ [translate_table: standard]